MLVGDAAALGCCVSNGRIGVVQVCRRHILRDVLCDSLVAVTSHLVAFRVVDLHAVEPVRVDTRLENVSEDHDFPLQRLRTGFSVELGLRGIHLAELALVVLDVKLYAFTHKRYSQSFPIMHFAQVI